MRQIFYFFTFVLFLFVSNANAQDAGPGPGSVTVYSEDRETFTLYLNGEQANATPAARVVIPRVNEVPIAFRIVFQNTTTPELKKKGLRQGTNCLFAIETKK